MTTACWMISAAAADVGGGDGGLHGCFQYMCLPCFGSSETGAVGCVNKMNVSFLLFLNRLISLQTMPALLRNARDLPPLVGLLCCANIYIYT